MDSDLDSADAGLITSLAYELWYVGLKVATILICLFAALN